MSDVDPFYHRIASAEWSGVKRRATVERLLNTIRFNHPALIPFDEVRTKLKLRHPNYGGIQEIPISGIVGSVGRYRDFTRTFLPRSDAVRERWQRVSAVMTAQGLPPIKLYKVGDAYFVADGNHRISVAKAHGADTIEAEVWDYPTPTSVPLSDKATFRDVIFKAEEIEFFKRTNLNESLPDHNIHFTIPGRYIEIEYHIALYQKVIEETEGTSISYEQAAVDWCRSVYEPTLEIIRRENLMQYFPNRTEADLFAWLARHRRNLSSTYDLPVSVQDLARQMRGRGPLAWVRRFRAKRKLEET